MSSPSDTPPSESPLAEASLPESVIAERKRRILLLVQYDGTDFHGWQVQQGLRTVCGELKVALERLTREVHCPSATSRTDSQVHARGLPVTTRTDTSIPLIGFARGLNTFLPPDLSISAAAEVPEDFHIRKNARGKRYIYRIWNGPTRSAQRARRMWHVPSGLDLDAMQRSSAALIGEHDFSAYRAAACQAAHPIRRVDSITIDGEPGGEVRITYIGNAFLQHMVRILTGTLIEVGRGHKPESFPGDALSARSRAAAGPTAPGHGLELDKVFYDPDPFRSTNAWPASEQRPLD